MSDVYEWSSGYRFVRMSLVMWLMSGVYEWCSGYRLVPMSLVM